MTGSFRPVAALLLLAATTAPLAAQTNSFAPGSVVESPAITGFQTTGAEMIGMQLTLDVAGGGLLNTTWVNLGGNVCGGSFANGFRVSLACNADTFTATWSVVGATNERTNSLRFNGAGGRTLFDCGWNGQVCSANGQSGGGTSEGTANSATGWTLETIAGGTFVGTVLGAYTNVVGVSGNAPIGDLYEQLTITWVGALGAGGTYNFRADTDNSLFDQPPPRIVPEPSTYALMFSGLVGIGFMARRRRSV